MYKAAAILAVMLATLAAQPVLADRENGREASHDDLYEARQRGDILPLPEILEMIRPQTGDRILEIEFEEEDGIPIYEIYFIDSSGHRGEIHVNAATGEILPDRKDD
ncbi:MAG: PepSY domain-containing protein [Tepidamorphaceae bacterium]|nr:PepSY domain-containing protein [Rhodobiaceae bacterium]MCC0048554.1 PepSY domain-containing protein [Rhodobiaceae bacterium]